MIFKDAFKISFLILDLILNPTNPHHLPNHCLIQHPALGLHHREPFAGTGDDGVYQPAGQDGVGSSRAVYKNSEP